MIRSESQSRKCNRIIIFVLVAMFLFGGTVLAQKRQIELFGSDKATIWSPSPAGAAFRSLLLPGWGQAYVKHPLKAVIYGGIEQALIYNVYRSNNQYHYFKGQEGFEISADNWREDRNRLSWYLAGAIILSMMDAYVDAHLYHFNVSDDLSSQQGFMGSGIIVNIGWRMP